MLCGLEFLSCQEKETKLQVCSGFKLFLLLLLLVLFFSKGGKGETEKPVDFNRF